MVCIKKENGYFFAGYYKPVAFEFQPKQGSLTLLSEVLEKDVDRKYCVSDYIRGKRWAKHQPTSSPSIWHENKTGYFILSLFLRFASGNVLQLSAG